MLQQEKRSFAGGDLVQVIFEKHRKQAQLLIRTQIFGSLSFLILGESLTGGMTVLNISSKTRQYVLRSVEAEGESQPSLTVQLNQRVGPRMTCCLGEWR